MELQGKRVLITGAARRVGAAIARCLAARGCEIVLHYHRSVREARQLADELRSLNVGVDLVRGDLERERDVLFVARAALKGGPVDILINNAAVYYATPWERLTSRDWQRFLQVNLTAPFLLSRELGTRMRRGGRIINLTDNAGERPYRRYLPYCVSKGALLSLTRSLALELAPKVLVNSISLGPILPPVGMAESVRRRIAKRSPLGRWGDLEGIMKAVVYLCELDDVTGTDLIVDGGFHLV